jgi:hypothetical protein
MLPQQQQRFRVPPPNLCPLLLRICGGDSSLHLLEPNRGQTSIGMLGFGCGQMYLGVTCVAPVIGGQIFSKKGAPRKQPPLRGPAPPRGKKGPEAPGPKGIEPPRDFSEAAPIPPTELLRSILYAIALGASAVFAYCEVAQCLRDASSVLPRKPPAPPATPSPPFIGPRAPTHSP